MSDTPETEAAVIASGSDWSPVLRETCRRLERERDEAIRELEKMKETKQELMQMVYGRNWVEQDLLKQNAKLRTELEQLKEGTE